MKKAKFTVYGEPKGREKPRKRNAGEPKQKPEPKKQRSADARRLKESLRNVRREKKHW